MKKSVIDVICYAVIIASAVALGVSNIGYWVLGIPLDSLSVAANKAAAAIIAASVVMMINELLRRKKLKPTA